MGITVGTSQKDKIVNLHWLIDVDTIGEKHQNVPAHLRAFGHRVTTLSATKDFPKLKNYSLALDENYVYVFHGSYEELNAVKKYVPVSTYGLGHSILRSHYTSYLPKSWFLNRDSYMTTWGNLTHVDFRNHDAIFIRPDSGNKTFTGQVISYNELEYQRKLLETTSNVVPETILWASTTKEIDAEYRVWISNKKIAAYSEYSWNDDKKLDDIVPKEALELAEKVASFEWQVDRIYVVDIAMQNKQASIIEFNSFSCSGLYNCDSEILFKTVSDDMQVEWNEE